MGEKYHCFWAVTLGDNQIWDMTPGKGVNMPALTCPNASCLSVYILFFTIFQPFY